MNIYDIESDRLFTELKINGGEFTFYDKGQRAVCRIERVSFGELSTKIRNSIFYNRYAAVPGGILVLIKKTPLPGLPVFVDFKAEFKFAGEVCTSVTFTLENVIVYQNGQEKAFLNISDACDFLDDTEFVSNLESLVSVMSKSSSEGD